ncbi:MAG TPA: NAD(P)/FAD-dependent oxidoreductase [Pyrinomonadaceae bacterium]|nr:NAD(P)/FAD-dependent oxidoreductase [Pyrinomonadaceae bacterium]
MTKDEIYDVAIAGAGPAGTSAAIHLAAQGMNVLLAEQKKFPRAKLCGEFISPECINHFERLGVAESIFAAKGATLIETSFYSRRGNKVTVPSHWFGSERAAIGLGRAEMDRVLLERAKRVGVTVLQEAHVVEPILKAHRVLGMRIKRCDQIDEYRAAITIDATGRTRALARKLKAKKDRQRARLVAFKAHLQNAQVAPGVCEIYFYRGGYGGLSNIEGGLSNLCFIAAARDVRSYGPDPQQILRATVLRNSRAAFALAEAQFEIPWLSVALESFGRHQLVPAEGLLLIGDAAAFIDPFTGSGMLMALESGAVAAQAILDSRHQLDDERSFSQLANRFRSNYAATFNLRLQVSGWLRRAAFVPRLAEAAIICFGTSDRLRRRVAQATRSQLTLKAPVNNPKPL